MTTSRWPVSRNGRFKALPRAVYRQASDGVAPLKPRGLRWQLSATQSRHAAVEEVEEVGSAVKTVRPGQFVFGSFALSDNTCPHCRFGFQS